MDGPKLDLVKQTTTFVIQQLTGNDRFGVISYDDNVKTELPLTRMSDANKAKAIAAVNAIRAGSSTNLCAGLVAGIEMLRSSKTILKEYQIDDFASNDVASVLLLTDGLANIGHTTTPAILRATGDAEFAHRRPSRNDPPESSEVSGDATSKGGKHDPLPCTLQTFGYGSGHDSDLLRSIARHGSGVYYFVENVQQISDAFANCLGGLLSVVAQNIKVVFEIPDSPETQGLKIKKIMTRFKVREIQTGKKYEVNIGDIQSEEQRDILCALQLPSTLETLNYPLLKVTVSYDDVLADRQEILDSTAVIARMASSSTKPPTPNLHIDEQRNRVIAATAMEDAIDVGDKGNLAKARETVLEAMKKIQNSPSKDSESCAGLLNDLQKCLEGLRDRDTYTSSGGHYLRSYSHSHYAQRSTPTTSGYRTTSRDALSVRFSSSCSASPGNPSSGGEDDEYGST